MAVTSKSGAKQGFISKKYPESTSMDFEKLREIGIQTVQKYGNKKWTDYNLHDPGITILEILAYALSELGLKANSPIEDLLSSGNGDYLDLYKPAEILPILPVTTTDYRKLLVDQPNVRNAWITNHKTDLETNIYYDSSIRELSYSNGSKIKISGFYDVLIEFIDTSLNTNILEGEYLAASSNEYKLEIVYPYWDEIDSKNQLDLEILSVNVQTVPGTGGTTGVPEQKLQDEGDDHYFAVLEVSYVGGFSEDLGVHIKVSHEIKNIDRSELIDFVDSTSPGAIVELLVNTSNDSLIKQFVDKANQSKSIIADIKANMNNYRNLCEDFYSYKTVRTQEIGINADLDIMVGGEAEKVLAEIFFIVNQFISPLIKYKSYTELVNSNKKVEDIYDGPLLNNGFLESDQLNIGERIDIDSGEFIIYTSDLFNIIKSLNNTRLEGNNEIIDLRNFSLSNFINNQIVTPEARNCLKLSLSQIYKPKLSILKSNIRLFKAGLEVDYDIDTVIDLYSSMVQEELDNLQTFSTDVLSIPKGNKFDILEFSSIQNGFPLTYGIGHTGLPGDATDERKAQANQLKAFLLLFEQIYLNFNAQLNNIKELFSFSTNGQRTYFYQLLNEIPQLSNLLHSSYYSEISGIVEKDNSLPQYKRRNKFLNHLVARFGENPDNFEIIFLESYSNIQEKLISVKRKLLTDYPKLSSNRFKAYNYLLSKTDGSPDVWNTDNVSGYERRICHLLGFPTCKRRNLYNPVMSSFQLYQEIDVDAIDEQRFRLIDEDDNILLSSSMAFTDEVVMMLVINQVIQYGTDRANYKIITAVDDTLYFNLVNSEDDIIARRIEPFDTIEEIESAINEVIDFLSYAYLGEGLYVIEHHLLRPTIKGINDSQSHSFLPSSFNNDSKTVFADPYSFQMTVIIPSGYVIDFNDTNAVREEVIGMNRFRNVDFLRVMEGVIRSEAPAHLLLRIISLDVDSSELTGDTPSLNNFERVYKIWLETKADITSTENQLLLAQQELVAVLKKIYNPDTL